VIVGISFYNFKSFFIMFKNLFLLIILLNSLLLKSQSPVGRWIKISEINEYQGYTFDSHKALISQKPCAAKITYNINADGTFRKDATQSGCDEKYQKIQEKLYLESVWTISNNTISIGHKKAPKEGQTYTYTIKGNTMIWVGTEGQGTITYQKL
jgi:hypothetical protein